MMRKRVLSLLLIIAICIPMFGIFAYAEEDDTRLYPTGKGQYMEDSDSSGTPDRLLPGQSLKISTITVTGVKEPIHGVAPDNNFTVAEKGLTQKPNASGWLDVEAGRWMTSADTFQVDKMYEFRAFVIPKSGYTFSDSNITASMNGYATKVALGTEGARCVSYQFKCTGSSAGTLKEAYLYVDAPKVGEKPDEYAGTSTYDYVGDNVSWSPGDEVFKAGVAYTCTTFVRIDYFEGVFDENVKVYINDKEAEIVGRSEDLLQVEYTFPALPDESVGTLKEVYLYVDAPKVGEKPDEYSGTSTYDYVGENVSWSPNDEVFKAGVAYTCTTFVRIDYFEGVFDENVKVYINDKEAEIVGRSEDILQVEYTFPALPDESHSHIYGSTWEYDKNSHWHECECGNQSDIAEHKFDGSVCTVCGYKKPDSSSDTDSVTGSEPGSSTKPEYKFPFTDVPDNAWFRGDVEIAHKNGLINGKTETLYCPDDLMTYAEAIKLAATMNQLYYDGKVTLKSGDTQWYSTYMAYALEKGIIAEDMSLQADKSITRRDFVKIFRASMPSSEFPVINEVSDGKIPDVAMNADGAAQIYDFYRAGILVGSDTLGTFNPDSNIVRSEVAAILTRMFDNTARKTITLK
ncbi:MAG: S-layer homology domain-containing protein [Monoglobales bacterium]